MAVQTIQCRLLAPEPTRRHVWEQMARYTELVSTVLERLGRHPEFATWVQTGRLPAKVVTELVNQAKEVYPGLPARWYASATRQVQQTYDAWLSRRQQLQQRLQGLLTWLSVLQPDDELAQQAGVSLAELRARAQAWLASGGIVNWFQAYRDCQDPTQRSVLAYLLKHRQRIPDEPEQGEQLARRRRRVEIRMERLQAQLAGERPQGRDLTGQRWELALQEGVQRDWEDDAAFLRWQADIQTRPAALPCPVEYATNTDITWRQDDQGKLWVKLSGLGKHEFRVGCGQRQWHWFERFYQDQELFRQDPKQRSQALFTLRSVELVWKPGPGQGNPWDANDLYLHCTVDTRLWTQQGTEQVRQEKVNAYQQQVARLTAKPELTPTQQQCLARHQATLARLATDYPRPRRMPYQGQPHLVVGVAMDLDHLLTAVLVDVTQSKVIKQVTLRGLLGDDYCLVQRLRHLQQRHAHARHVGQQRGAKVADRETNLAVHVERLIAKALVQFAQQHLAGSLCLPRLADLREMVQADVQARAEKRFPDSKELQRRYAKQYRVSAHRWSYQRLLTAIRQRASLMGVPVEEGLPDVRAAPWQRALSVALSAYYQRKAA